MFDAVGEWKHVELWIPMLSRSHMNKVLHMSIVPPFARLPCLAPHDEDGRVHAWSASVNRMS